AEALGTTDLNGGALFNAEFGIRHRGSTVPERSGVALSFCRRRLNLANIRNISSADALYKELLSQAAWDASVAMDNISEFVEPDQGGVRVIERLVEFAHNSGIAEGQNLALEALAVLGLDVKSHF
ncbi:hypothetical protein, partial [Pseudomonas aeruginosa]|uniref:hypothetical protein n=1 Tax=Pseudomonas aeruginosa TaxID=287 RepID=UPI002FDFB1DD